ncbi:hypothetical protein ACO1O0_004931 [Amphichorda felina]
MSNADESAHFQRRNFNSERDVHLGTLRSLDDFYERMGTNGSDWTMLDPEQPERLSQTPAWDLPGVTKSSRTGSALMARGDDDKCADKDGIAYYVCEALPHRYFIWVAGVAVVIYWTPSFLDSFLDDVAKLIGNGINMQARYERIRNGHEGPVNKLKVRDLNMEGLDVRHLGLVTPRDDFEPEYIHFNIENEMAGMAKRDLSGEEGILAEARSYTRYALRSATGELEARGVDATLSADSSKRRDMERAIQGRGDKETAESNLVSNLKPGTRAAAKSEEWRDWSIIITADRSSSYFPDSSQGCIVEFLRDRLNAAASDGRHSCMHLSEKNLPSNYFTYTGVFINKGGSNWALPFGECCA